MKEDDMDEMMRKAAENYEVDAEHAADWQAVYKAVHESEDGAPPEEKEKKRRFAFWWLLLIPLGWIANTEYNSFKNAHTKEVNSSPVAESKTNSNDQNTSSAASGLKNNNVKDNNNTAKENSTAAETVTFSLKHFTANSNSHKVTQTSNNDNVSNNNTVVQNQQLGNNNTQTSPQSAAPVTIISGDNSNSVNNPSDKTVAANETNNTSPALINDTATHHNNNAVTTKPSVKTPKTNAHYFYVGVVAGADLSFVKYQDVEPLGYNAGLLVGYKFSKRLSIESGFYLVKKNYYTDSEYFDESKLHFFDDNKLVNANGYCKMFEIPLNIKYDISTRKKHTWFATAGLSTYLMNKEYYDFNYIDTNGVEKSLGYPYYKTTKNWFSILNLSVGYQLQTGKKTNIRIEPYYKTALTGVGTGSLSISSIGINAGIVRRIP